MRDVAPALGMLESMRAQKETLMAMMKMAHMALLQAEMRQRIALVQSLLRKGAPGEQRLAEAQVALAELEELTKLITDEAASINRTNVWLRMRLNRR
jgi:hypothetical protein